MGLFFFRPHKLDQKNVFWELKLFRVWGQPFLLLVYFLFFLSCTTSNAASKVSTVSYNMQVRRWIHPPLCRSSFGLRAWVLCRGRLPSPHAWHRWCQRSLLPLLHASARSCLGPNSHLNTETQAETGVWLDVPPPRWNTSVYHLQWRISDIIAANQTYLSDMRGVFKGTWVMWLRSRAKCSHQHWK